MGIFNRNTRGGVTIDITTNAKQAAEDVDELNTKYKELTEELNKGVQLQALAKSLDDAYKAGKNVITALGQIDKRTKEGKAFHELSAEDQTRLAGIYKESKDNVVELYGAMLESIQAAENFSKANEEVASTTEDVAESVSNAASEVENYKDKVEDTQKQTETYSYFIDKFTSLVVKNSQKLNAEQRELRFTNALYEGMFHSMRKIINSTKILNGAVGLLSSAFGFIIDMIFLPLLPIAVALAEFLFGVGDAIHTVLDFIGGISPGVAQVISLITLATGAMLLFLGGSFITGGVPGLTLLLEGVLSTISSIKNGLSEIINFGGGDTPAPAQTKTPTGAGKFAGLVTFLETIGGFIAGFLGGNLIVQWLTEWGVMEWVSDLGKSAGIQDMMHGGEGYNVFETGLPDWLKTTNPLARVMSLPSDFGNFINASQTFWSKYIAQDYQPMTALTADSIEKAIREGLYSDALQNVLDTKFGENTFGFVNSAEGVEAGYYYFGGGETPIGSRQTSMSSMVSTASNVSYTTNYNNTNGNGALSLYHIAGLL